jgi:two-component system, OmpR family, sensor histidine kinase KdpD
MSGLKPRFPSRDEALGALASVAAVAVVTGAIELLKPHVPVLSLGVLYIFAVLPIAIVWGLGLGITVAVASMLALNFFFLPPLYTFTLADSRNWFALAVFLVTAVVVSELAARSRRQARESALLARIATSLLAQGSVSTELERIAAEAAQALQVERARIFVDADGPLERGNESYPLAAGDREVGAIYLDGASERNARARRRLLPALASLLGVAIDRERLAREAYEAEALRRSDAMKTALLRAVSHDLRSPLMAILTSAGALVHGDLSLEPTDRRELGETILGEAERLDRLVSNLLDLSRLQAAAANPEPEVSTIEDLVLQALDSVEAAGDRIEVSLPEDSASVRVDTHQVERVLANLVENALHYSPPSEPVRVQVSESGSEVLVRVIDRGPGIAPGEAEQIFAPFQRGTRTGEVRGAGLGLAIARGFAEANGGRVWAESREGQGATFVLALRLVPAVAEVRA